VELLKDNPDWDTTKRQEDFNHFMARLIFCFFAEDTGIFHGSQLFTDTVTQMSTSDASNTHEVLSEIFRAMATPLKGREAAKVRNWANGFPYANGGLFSGSGSMPRFSRLARSYLLHVGNLDWTWKSLDYVSGWFMKAADYGTQTQSAAAFVSTNSICQGQQVPILWPLIFETGHEIAFAHTSFKWANLASHNAGVTVVIVGISNHAGKVRRLFSSEDNGETVAKESENINAYLVTGVNVIVEKATKPLSNVFEMNFGNKPVDGGNLLLSTDELNTLGLSKNQRERFIRRIYGSAEFIRGLSRYCLWIEDKNLEEALTIEPIRQRIEGVRKM
jgi:hypothetical protein